LNKKVISLLSDGFDSPVAAYLMMKQGFLPVFLTFLTTVQEEADMREKIGNVLNKLSKFSQTELKAYLIPYTSNLEIFKNRCSRKLTCILCKRMMLRVACQIADKETTRLILTGDILGEQASQTLSNLYSYNAILKNYIKLMPLIGLNKMDVININKIIGLYSISSNKINSCQYYPQYPETNVKKKEIKRAENKINLSQILENTLKSAQILKF
jgi:thiamine biosynthesis protein ThiI